MKPAACEFESRVLELARGTAGDPGETIARHLEGCASCRDLSLVASTISADARSAMRSAPVPGSGLVWWRVQQRARREAMQAASRAVTWIQAVTVAAGVAVAGTIVSTQVSLESLSRFAPSHLLLDFAVILGLATVPFALYLTFARD